VSAIVARKNPGLKRIVVDESVLKRGVPGFRFAGVVAGIKKKGGRDVALLVCEQPAATAAVFTQNHVKAAPVRLSQRHLKKSKGSASAIVVNSGNANACTGPQGDLDARAMADQAAYILGAASSEILVCSTGVIGQPLPMKHVSSGILSAAAQARREGFGEFAEAILTTDKRAKMAVRRVKIGSTTVTLLGCTKGAGMIMPNMATTLTFVATDVSISPALLQSMTATACDATFNAIAVDGDTSTNDTLTVTASGVSTARVTTATSPSGRMFAAALGDLLGDLATQLMSDGEGVHHVARVIVRGAASAAAARTIARRVAISPLVKTAIAGGDPNWGRILCAVGNAGVAIDASKIALDIAGIATVRHGFVVPRWNEKAVAQAMKSPTYDIELDLGRGSHISAYLACDLSHDYVSINADYRS
jgi:glutamate N-acetyltransferase / amino-acid N-acetyltransferase